MYHSMVANLYRHVEIAFRRHHLGVDESEGFSLWKYMIMIMQHTCPKNDHAWSLIHIDVRDHHHDHDRDA
jgi:hypothetical protein